MNKRILGKTGFEVTEIGLGTWQVGGTWGQPFSTDNAEKILHEAIDLGVNFIDTADVYSGGESEKVVGRIVKQYHHKIYVATKCGRKIAPHIDSNYSPQILRQHVEDSLKNTGLECIDLIQLHCMPNDTYYRPEIFEEFNNLKQEGKIKFLGVSVEKVEQAIKAMEYDNVATIQIIFNPFRQRPNELFFQLAQQNNVGIIARVPLASGLLSGKFNENSIFGAGDHRQNNRNGEYFDKGETFGGIPYSIGLEAVKYLKEKFPNENLSHLALRWILMFEEVSTVIPGASKPGQTSENLKAVEYPALTNEGMLKIKEIYEMHIKSLVHQQW